MTDLEFDLVDVFTTTAFAGNPLAVVYGSRGLADAQLQALAREFNHSETAFAQPWGQSGDYDVRIFTPQIEVPFAGHPTLGVAWALAQRGLVAGPHLRQHCRLGVIDIELGHAGQPTWLVGGTPQATLVDPALADELLAAVGIPSDRLLAPVVLAGAGLTFGYVFVQRPALADARPDLVRLRRLSTRPAGHLGGVSVVAWDDRRVRVFGGQVPGAEDPATGSAALGLAAAAVRIGLLPADGRSEFALSQGIELGRPATLYARVDAVRARAVGVQVGGVVVQVGTGRIYRPSP